MVTQDRDQITTWLDVLSLVAIVAGVVGALWPYVEWAALILGGVLLGVASWTIARPPSPSPRGHQ